MTMKPTVYFDGACPLCRREIAFYRDRKGADAVEWVDVCEAGPERLGAGLGRDEALRRFHVRDAEGKLLSGADAFGALWLTLPGFRWAGRIVLLPGVRWFANRVYDFFLILRPAMQRLAGRLDQNGKMIS